MTKQVRCCENCGNWKCANSVVAYYWDECVDTNFEAHWMPKEEAERDYRLLHKQGGSKEKMKTFRCQNCGVYCYSAADQKTCARCQGKLKEVSMTEKKDAPDILEDDHDAKIQLQYIAEPKKNQIPEEILRELARMSRRFYELYRNFGFTSFDSYGNVHLSGEAFLATFQEYKSEARDSAAYPEELSAIFDGAKFFCIR